ncbi:MAG TPA: Nramp family divalent metal transporter [Chloroflexota bacterium]|jgi:hypothetical protein|nr:Nramp family divalent metal transporter [Chloroflexota bacterium]
MADAKVGPPTAAVATDVMHKVPDPYPLTWAGMIAMLGPQAINFGISVGGGEAYLLPNIGARGTFHLHWLMLISVVLESALVYECIKYSMNTGRSFFAGTVELGPKGFWPWYWSIVTLLVFGWPAWMGGAVIAARQFTGISTQTLFPRSTLPPQYLWAVVALVLVLAVFYFSNRTYDFLQRFFLFIMFGNIVLLLAITAIAAQPHHYWAVLKGFLGITFLTEGGYPAGLPQTDALALFGQPGGSIMFVSFWVLGAGYAMGKYAGQVTGPLRPPQSVTAAELRWDSDDPEERRKMRQWIKLGGYGLFFWWAFVGGIIMVYLYSVAGYAYLHEDFKLTGKVPSGVDVPLQMATIAAGVLGPAAGWLMLLFVMVTLLDAQFPIYDTFIGRTTCDAIAATRLRQGRLNAFMHRILPAGLRNRPYRFWYFVVVTLIVLAGLWMVMQTSPFIIWLAGSVFYLINQAIGAIQIMLLNNRRLHPDFRVGKINTVLLPLAAAARLTAVGVWLYAGGLAEIVARWQAGG